MTMVPVTWSNLKTDERLFVVYHRAIPLGCEGLAESAMLIPDRWGKYVPSGRCLMTEASRRALDYQGEGVAVAELPPLNNGDVVLLDVHSRRLEVVFAARGTTNSLYVTNSCNSHCRFCPQPSTPDDGWLYDIAEKIICLVKNPGECVNVTGGEPTIRRDRFVSLVKRFSETWKTTKAFVLTNGRLLADADYVDAVYSAIDATRIAFGIPLYSDSAIVHDRTVGVQGAFGQTIRGLYNLVSKHAEIEIRFVVSKITYKRLPQLVEFIGRNLPFVTRIAVMGIEPMGHCRSNWADYWIDPEDAMPYLERAVRASENYNLDLVLYNMQLCCLPERLRRYSCVSISEWKRSYLDCCLQCPMKADCGGFFASQNNPEYLPRRFAS